MAYVGVAKALYDYDAQNPEDEISFKEDQLLYIVEKEDDEWWKAKIKVEGGEGAVGLVPCTYVEEQPALRSVRSLYSYESTSPEELTVDADVDLEVFAEEDEWLLVRADGELLGFVPRNYCEGEGEEAEEDDGAAEAEEDDGAAEAEAAQAAAAAAAEAARQEQEQARAAAAKQRELALKDKLESWSIAELDGKKKKKGQLSVGQGAIYFTSDSDKSPIKQHPITGLSHVEQEGSKVIALTIAGLPSPLRFHTGSSKTTKSIVDKLASSKQLAGEVLNVAEGAADSSDEEAAAPPMARRPSEPKTVRFSEPASPVVSAVTAKAPTSGMVAVVMYDFEANGGDELNVTENERVTVVDPSDPEWWVIRNARGQEGAVPAQYVELAVEGDEPAFAAPAAGAAAAAAAEQRRREDQMRSAARAEKERLEREQAARERAEQEEMDRELAEHIEAEERDKRREADERARKEAQRRRGKNVPPPGDLDLPVPTRDRAAAAAAAARPEQQRPKPNPSRVRTWSDRTGQFTVEAEFLGLNGNKLRLHKTNGVVIEVPVEKMSNEDINTIKRYQSRKKERSASVDEDDTPLGRSHQPRRPSQQVSHETERRGSVQPQRTGNGSSRPKKPTYDWFGFFLEAGCDMDDCTRYAANFDRDRIDETLLPELDVVTMRSLGLREGDLIRVRKYIQVKFGKNDVAASGAGAGAGAGTVASPAEEAPAAGLFTGPGGRLANNTRRGRPQRNATLPDTVDSDALAAASSQLSKVSLTPLEPAKPATPALASPVPPVSISPPPEEKKKPESGFDDDAWAIKPVAKAPSPSPVPVVTSPTEATGTDALLAQIQSLRPSSTGAVPGGAAFESIAAANAAIPQRAKSATLPPPSSYGLGGMPGVPLAQLAANATGMPQQMPQQVQQVPQVDLNAPRGPLAPVPANQGLLNPMHPQATGMFIPTHPTGVATQSPFAGGVPAGQYFASASAAAGMQPMATGMPVQPLQNMYTGFQQQSTFNTVAAIPPPAPVQPQATGAGGDKFAPSNIFNAMKRTDYGKREEEAAQAANKYDALRPLTTGYNGAPGLQPAMTGMPMGGMGMGPMGMQQQPQGMMPNATGMPMMGVGMGMGMGMQPTGMPQQYPNGMYMGQQGYGY